jgi:hypothetical protein
MTWQPVSTAEEDTVVLVFDPKGITPEFANLSSSSGWPILHVFPARCIDGRWQSCMAECDHGVWDDPSHERFAIGCSPTHGSLLNSHLMLGRQRVQLPQVCLCLMRKFSKR